MKGYRFYEEFGTKQGKRKGESQGNCVAVYLKDDGSPIYWIQNNQAMGEAIGALTDDSNSQVCCTNFSFDWLRETCKRVSEARARVVHPELFKRLDMDNQREVTE